MSVLAEAISVIHRVDRLEERFPGGAGAYAAGVPNRTFCTDGTLTRVGFMHPGDVESWVRHLEVYSLALDPQTGESDSCVVVDQFGGPTVPCRWIRFTRHPDGYSYCWLAGSDPGDLAFPEGWRLSTLVRWSQSTEVPGAIEALGSRPWDPSTPMFTVRPADRTRRHPDTLE